VSHLSSGSASSASLAVSNLVSGSYTYLADVADSKLSDAQKKQYEEQGFIVVKKLVPEADLKKWTTHFQNICDGKTKKTRSTIVMRDVAIAKKAKEEKGEKVITKLQDWQDDDTFFDYCKHPAILPWVESIIGPNVKAVHTMLINKPPDVGLGSSRHPPHQDLWYFPFRPANKIVCAWTAMQKIDKVNGCLFVKPGTHKGELLKHEYPNDGIVNKAYHGVQGLSSEEEGKKMLNCEMEPGDTIFFHPLLIHGSGRNNSAGFRKAISCHYAASDCHYEDPHGTIQEDIAKEIEELKARKKKPITYVDYFRSKMRLVSGKEGTL
jgi:phytanoyl-CoA hydroxylase